MKTLELLQKKREKIYQLAKECNVSNIRVFGSVARGEEKKNSDVDLLVSVGSKASLMTLVRLEKALEKETDRKVQIISDKAVNKHIKPYITSEIVTL